MRKAALEKLLRPRHDGIRLCEHVEFDDAEVFFEHVCQLGCEGMVSKRLGSRYVSGRSRDWVKTKNPNSPSVRRELKSGDFDRAGGSTIIAAEASKRSSFSTQPQPR